MRRLLCLAAAGLFVLSGTAAAATPPPSRESGPPPTEPVVPRPGGSIELLGPFQQTPGKASRGTKTLVLSIARGERALPASRFALLACDSPNDTTSSLAKACEALEGAGGDPAGLKPLQGMACTLQYEPVTVTATGIWNRRFVRFERTFGNPCELRVATGPVFGLWNGWSPQHPSIP
ncbi:hypothetical protein GCM10010517_45740 [Streptosporangium fragile]|uniref:Subtilisin inhibitor domain-containing protein n=1 Tax=Streptosporangium fragile TaxID=46186 RepID=A0ABN3W2R3_9ACTN